MTRVLQGPLAPGGKRPLSPARCGAPLPPMCARHAHALCAVVSHRVRRRLTALCSSGFHASTHLYSFVRLRIVRLRIAAPHPPHLLHRTPPSSRFTSPPSTRAASHASLQICPSQDYRACALAAVKTDLSQLAVAYADLVLLHDPGLDNETATSAALWQGLQDAQVQGLARAIGVSNFSPKQLQEVRVYD